MLAERLRAARQARFVGRTAEKEVFRSALLSPELPFHLLHIYGPGGVGKTTLVQEYKAIAQQHNFPAIYLDARNIEPVPEAFLTSLRQAMNIAPADSFHEAMTPYSRYVILFDTCENLAPLDDWLREVFLPQLSENALVVMSGRTPPSPAWRADPGWQSLMYILPLRNLAPDDSLDYLARRNIPASQHRAVLGFTHGHPLALSLVADVFAQREDVAFEPEQVPNIVKTLLEQFVQKVPGPAHRAALEACALVRLTTESLLAEMLSVLDAHELFNWLNSLSFIETGPEGIFPHDLAREALATDVRWRNPEWYAELHKRARKHYFDRFQQSAGASQPRILTDYIYLHRDNPLVKPFFEWQTGGNILADVMQPGDVPLLTQMVHQLEGAESARLASYWFARQPDGVLVMRDGKRQPLGFVMLLALHHTTADDVAVDPAVRAAKAYLQNHTPLRTGESATLFRFWMTADDYQGVSPVQSQIFVNMVRHYLSTPGLAFTFLPCHDPDFWLMAFSYADLTRLPQVDFTVGERPYGIYGHDWRIVPPLAWLELLGQREVNTAPNATPPPPVEQMIVLSENDFADAVQAALKDFVRPDALLANPLLRSRLVMERKGLNASETERVSILRQLLRDAADSLQGSPRELKFFRPLYHTYIQPAPTQEQAAELLDLPFSSFRRHLKSGIERVTAILWLQEIGSPEVTK